MNCQSSSGHSKSTWMKHIPARDWKAKKKKGKTVSRCQLFCFIAGLHPFFFLKQARDMGKYILLTNTAIGHRVQTFTSNGHPMLIQQFIQNFCSLIESITLPVEYGQCSFAQGIDTILGWPRRTSELHPPLKLAQSNS